MDFALIFKTTFGSFASTFVQYDKINLIEAILFLYVSYILSNYRKMSRVIVSAASWVIIKRRHNRSLFVQGMRVNQIIIVKHRRY